jgi:hypothetical protein
MTAQIAEKLHYRGEVLSLCSTPLGPYIATTQHTLKLVSPHTALWRGYVGTWSIEDGRLYLIDIVGHAPGSTTVGLKDFFPNATDGVFAHWFTGDLRCPVGGLMKYRHMGFGSLYEKDLFIRVSRGVVQEEHTVVNGTAPIADTGGFRVGAATFLGDGSKS